MRLQKQKNELISYLVKNYEYGKSIQIQDIFEFFLGKQIDYYTIQILIHTLANDGVLEINSENGEMFDSVILTSRAYSYVYEKRRDFFLTWYPHMLSTMAFVVSLFALFATILS